MKTRIRVVEYGDGRKEYFPEVSYNFKKHFVSMFESEPFWCVAAFFLSILFALLWSQCWDEIQYESEHENGYTYYPEIKTLDVAKKAVDNFILIHETDKAQKAAKKLSEKKVKTEILDYP